MIGEELNSGNYIAVDYNRKSKNSEYPIILLSHEIPFGESEAEEHDLCIANSVDEMLLMAAHDPVDFLQEKLGDTASYFDGKTDGDWYPNNYSPIS